MEAALSGVIGYSFSGGESSGGGEKGKSLLGRRELGLNHNGRGVKVAESVGRYYCNSGRQTSNFEIACGRYSTQRMGSSV